jgi:serine-type D-Ala-D-Ala carboxypeptidase/endopeptidase
MKLLIWVFFLQWNLSFNLLPSKEKNIENQIDALAAEYLKNSENAGISIGIITPNLEKTFSYGLKNKNQNDLIDAHTIFEIGSITKIFTSILLANEIQENQLSLEKPITDFFKNEEISGYLNKITLKHLATHSSGLPRLADNFWANVSDPENPYHSYSSDNLFSYLKEGHVNELGKNYVYSNVGFGLLGYILCNKNNCTYDNLVVKNVCSPLGLENTNMFIRSEQEMHIASGHSKGNTVKAWDFSEANAGQGALKSNTIDMLKFMRANMQSQNNYGIFKALNLTQQTHFSDLSNGMQTGLGWHIGSLFEEKYIEHTGGTGGFRSFIGICPNTGKGVVVLSNSDNDVSNLGIDVFKIINHLPSQNL